MVEFARGLGLEQKIVVNEGACHRVSRSKVELITTFATDNQDDLAD